VLDRPVHRERVIADAVAFQMVSMLRDVVERGTGRGARDLGVRGAIAGKTGTTDGYRDAWFVGFSASLVAGVWVGFDQPSSIGREAYGARVALPIWADFMKRAASQFPAAEFPVPDSVHGVELCGVSYLKPVEGCPVYIEYFKDGDARPSGLCPIHHGTFKQQAERAVRGFLRGIGGKIAGLFRRSSR
jgi:membrane carboxypeptidase/penicillin-binding protein